MSIFYGIYCRPEAIFLAVTYFRMLIHWGRVTQICVNKLTIIDSDNGVSSVQRLAIIWTSAGILLIGPLGTNFSEILIKILTFSFKKMRLKMSSATWWPFWLGLSVIRKSYGSNGASNKTDVLVRRLSFRRCRYDCINENITFAMAKVISTRS